MVWGEGMSLTHPGMIRELQNTTDMVDNTSYTLTCDVMLIVRYGS